VSSGFQPLATRFHDPTRISVGTLDNTPVEPREVFKAAILNNAKAIIALHNHSSGEPAPSLGDIHISKLLKRAGEILRIALLDHIIIGDAAYVSLKERKIVNKKLDDLEERADEIGKLLSGNLAGCREIKLRDVGIRIFYRIAGVHIISYC
jgi:mRNA-degrading endonuclease RelE of RelBE toxin-antitoxin system